MAYIAYGQATVGGKQLAEAAADLVAAVDKWRDLTAWIEVIGPSALDTNTDFSAATADKQALNDTVVKVNYALTQMMAGAVIADPESVRDLLAQIARGS